jgi:large conductance mechanosensitive channel
MIAEFKDCIDKGGVLGLAIGIIFGAAVGKLVTALVADLIMPIPGGLFPGSEWRKIVISIPIGSGINFGIGDFVGVIIDFLIIAMLIFLIAKYAKKVGISKDEISGKEVHKVVEEEYKTPKAEEPEN